MIPLKKYNLLGVLVTALDYKTAVASILEAAKEKRAFAVTALAVHGLMTGVGDKTHRYRLNHFDLVTPDGQPVRWALNLLYQSKLADRVYGPTLMLAVCEAAAKEKLPIYLYGSHQEVLEPLCVNLKKRFPELHITGAEPSKFRRTSSEEKHEISARIKASGACITFVGLGCPRQEVFVYEYHELLEMPVLAVGAAFDYHAGLLKEPPLLMQRYGLQWFYRLCQEPRRLWRRYLILNTNFVVLFLLQALKVWRPSLESTERPPQELLYG